MFKVCAFTKADISAEYNAFLTAFGITDSGGEEEPDVPVEPDEPTVTLSSISVTYSGGDVVVGTVVNDLTGIVVTAHYSDGTSKAVTGYALSGTIAEGSNTITVSYGGMTATFIVTGVAESGGGDDSTYAPELVWEEGKRIEAGNGTLIDASGWSVCQLLDISAYTSARVMTSSTQWFSATVFAGTDEHPKTVLKTDSGYWGGSYMTDETFDVSEYNYLRISSGSDRASTFTVELS
jgi:hypothetical protein